MAIRKGARDALVGIAAGILAILIVVLRSLGGHFPVAEESDRLMALSIRLTELGAPLSLLVLKLADLIGADSPLFPVVYFLLLASILVEWALAALFVAWLVRRFRIVRNAFRSS